MSDSSENYEDLQSELPLESIYTIRVILLQLKVQRNKMENVKHCCEKIREAVDKYGPGSDTWTIRNRTIVCILPEYLNCPNDLMSFRDYAENVPEGYTSNHLSLVAGELGINIIAGAIPECSHSGRPPIYSTCAIYSTEGEVIGKYRKLHLYDVDAPGCYPYKESDVFTAGKHYITTNIDNAMFGVGIGYDIRFEELARVYRKEGCNFLVYPATFSASHGPRDWLTLQRARAMDTQCFIATVAQARDERADFLSHGHSSLIDPFGNVVASAGIEESIIASDIDFNLVDKARAQIPISVHRRTDIYDTIIY
ncbi:omega-amidase NIT2-like [Phlebotomus papatasi]|uniref:omega-amidase NIT2-like n=1 Tax=Phlebotomus papatasi TaxID=29031 RepID=UPI0024839DD1|nr:omega-amidase NIT2-like [Phlebotomus papatasi]